MRDLDRLVLKRIKKACLFLFLCLMFCACTGQGQLDDGNREQTVTLEQKETEMKKGNEGAKNAPLSFAEMKWEEGLALSHANQFFVEKFEDYYLITIVASDRFLLIPEGKTIPEEIPADVIILQKPIKRAYLASSSVFDLIRQADALDHLRLSGTKKEDLCILPVAEKMDEGKILFAGKYSKPDFELLLQEGCDLAIENTMIYHNPETKEKLESLGIPVLVETSSYEEHPFGRMEWIKLYGLLFDHPEEAETFFDAQIQQLEPVLQQDKTGLKVAFFYVNSNGVINVRKPNDYVAKMVSLAGGIYVPELVDLQEENALSTMNMQMEDFYLAAKDADILIYNGTIVGELEAVQDLVEINPVFADFKAVKEQRVYCTCKNFFQETTAIGNFVEDLGKALRDSKETEFYQLKKLR